MHTSIEKDPKESDNSNDSIPQQFLDELWESADILNINILMDLLIYNEAMKGLNVDDWQEVVKREIKELKNQNTWTLDKLFSERKTLKEKWIYKTKRDSYRAIQRYKAHYMIKEYL